MGEAEERIEKSKAVSEVRLACTQFADLYYFFVKALREEFGDEKTMDICRKALFARAHERGMEMRERAAARGVRATPENINSFKDIPYLGWVKALGNRHCPYGESWLRRIEGEPWFRAFASYYCDVNDTTVGEVFLQDHSHKILQNVVNGDPTCTRSYFPDKKVSDGEYTYADRAHS